MTAKGEKKKVKSITNEQTEEIAKKLSRVADDLSMLLREGKDITTTKGASLKVPALTGKTEKAIISTVVGFLKDNSWIVKKIFGGDEIEVRDILEIVVDNTDNGYEVLQKLAANILNKEIDWVDKNLLLPDLISIVVPFIKAEMAPILRIVQSRTSNLGKETPSKDS